MSRRNARCGGFTLVELMVSITGGLFVAIAVFMLAKQSTNLYQQEGRIGNATMGALVGFERLKQDIERASFLMSPNVRTDTQHVCPPPDAAWPGYLAHLQGVMIAQAASGTVIPAVLSKNGSYPDEITVSGSFASSELFYAARIPPEEGNMVYLQSDKGGLAKLGYATLGSSAAQATLLSTVFGVGRILRIVDKSNGGEVYGTIAGVQGGSPAAIVMKNGVGGPPLSFRSGSGSNCGIAGYGAGSVVNVVNTIHYSIRDDIHANTAYAPLFDNHGYGPAGDLASRAELVREELDSTGTAIDGTQEIVSEFAVDLKFGVTVATVPSGSRQVSALQTVAPGDSDVSTWAGSTASVTGPATSMPPAQPTPQLVRAVRVRLGVRSREADRITALDGGGTLPMAPGMYRIGTNPTGGGPYARVRTMQADVALRNQQGANFL